MSYIVCPKCKNGCATQDVSEPTIVHCKVCGVFHLDKETLPTLVQKCMEIANKHGWQVNWRKTLTTLSVPEALSLVHSELSEALEAYRDDNIENFEEEISDVFIRLFHLIGDLKLNILDSILTKIEINKKRPYKHGRKIM